MAIQRMPLGHKRRGEAELANSPVHRKLRARIAHAARQVGSLAKLNLPGHKSEPPYLSGSVRARGLPSITENAPNWAPRRHGHLRDFHN